MSYTLEINLKLQSPFICLRNPQIISETLSFKILNDFNGKLVKTGFLNLNANKQFPHMTSI